MLNQNHSHNTRAATCHILDFLQLKTTHFGRHSVKFQASETWNKLQRTQNLNLLTSAPSELKKKNCFRHILPNTAITPRAIFHLLYIAILYFILFYFFMSLMSSLLVTHILDYQYDNYLVKYIDYCYCSHFHCYISDPIFTAIVLVNAIIIIYLLTYFFFSMLLVTFRDALQFY